jgi:hypothetical protein
VFEQARIKVKWLVTGELSHHGNYALRRLDRDGHAAVAAPIAASFQPSLRR